MWTETQTIARVSTILQDAGTALWGTAEIRQGLDNALITYSEYEPRVAKATVTFAGTARELSISSISDLMDVDLVEFPIDKHPRRYVNFSVRGSSVILDDYKEVVSTSDTAYIWYTTPHVIDGTATNTLNVRAQSIVADLAAGEIAINKANKLYQEANGAITTLASAATAVDNMSAQILRASTAIAKGGTAMDLIPAIILEAGTAMDDINAMVLQAGTAIASATALINTITEDDTPQTDWLNTAQGYMSIANSYINEAQGYISVANADGNTSAGYGNEAMRDLSVANQYLNQASGYFRKAASQFNVTSAGRYLENWGTSKVNNATRKLAGLVKPNFAVRYPDVE